MFCVALVLTYHAPKISQIDHGDKLPPTIFAISQKILLVFLILEEGKLPCDFTLASNNQHGDDKSSGRGHYEASSTAHLIKESDNDTNKHANI